jgi:hypothetical protein
MYKGVHGGLRASEAFCEGSLKDGRWMEALAEQVDKGGLDTRVHRIQTVGIYIENDSGKHHREPRYRLDVRL